LSSTQEEADRREAEALEALRRGARRRWLLAGLVAVGVTAWVAYPMLWSPCEKARVEICRKLMVSCKRTTARMENDPPPREWCEQLLDPAVLENRGEAAQRVIDRYPGVVLTQDEMQELRDMSARSRRLEVRSVP
jgi:hypothetical protein